MRKVRSTTPPWFRGEIPSAAPVCGELFPLRPLRLRCDGQCVKPMEVSTEQFSPIEQGEDLLTKLRAGFGEADVVAPAVGDGHRGLVGARAKFDPVPLAHRPPAARPEHVSIVWEDAIRPRCRVAM